MDRHSVGDTSGDHDAFSRTSELDLTAMERLLDWLLQEGMHGIIIGGTQGEWFTMRAVRETLVKLGKVQ